MDATRFSIPIRMVHSLYNHIIIESTMDSDKSVPESIPLSETTQDQISNVPNVQYNGILVPHDGSEKSDVALRHAIYLSKLSGA